MKIRPVGADLFLADRRTDGHDEANNSSSPFCECAYKPHTSHNTRSKVEGHLSSKLRKIHVHNNIQSVPGGMCETSGECSLGQTIPI